MSHAALPHVLLEACPALMRGLRRTSGNPDHQAEQLAVFSADFPALTDAELQEIDDAGVKWQQRKVDEENSI